MLNGVIDTCVKHRSPVIIAIHPDELEYVGDSFVKTIRDIAYKVDIPVVIHLDHGASIEQILRAIRAGFTLVMIDGSLLEFEDNVAVTKKTVEIAHPVNVSVEAELGTIGTTEGDTEGGTEEIIFTQPDEAMEFVKRTNCNSLAVAIGTAHGIYPKNFKPELKLELLSQIKEKVSVPLVLHGGSANPDEEIAEAVNPVVNKINIFSDIKSVFYEEARRVLKDKGLREPNMNYPSCIEKMNEVVKQKIKLFKSDNKAFLYCEEN